jgi:hypothetical protein
MDEWEAEGSTPARSDGNAHYLNALIRPVTHATRAYALSPYCRGNEWRGGPRRIRV